MSKNEKTDSIRKTLFESLVMVIASEIIVLMITSYVAKPMIVRGESMYPTLQNGSVGFANIINTKFGSVDRFDIVVIRTDNGAIIKRVIGLPGDTMEYSNGSLYVNDEKVDEPFLDNIYAKSSAVQFTGDIKKFTLGDDEYYCLGDNRPASKDSRYYGAFHKEQILADGIWIAKK